MRTIPLNGAQAYRLAQLAYTRVFTLALRRSFFAWGKNSVAFPPLRVNGESWISVGSRVSIGPGCWLNAIPWMNAIPQKEVSDPVITIADSCGFSGNCTISAAYRVTLGREVLLGQGVYVGDHDHAFTDTTRPVIRQGITNVRPVHIGDGAWLGNGVVVTSGVRVGRGAVVAAGAVVTRDVPDFSLAAGIPAKVVKSWQPS